MTLARHPQRMKQFCVKRLAFGVKSSFGAQHNTAIGLTLNAQPLMLNPIHRADPRRRSAQPQEMML